MHEMSIDVPQYCRQIAFSDMLDDLPQCDHAKWDGAFAFENAVSACAVVYQRDAKAGQTQPDFEEANADEKLTPVLVTRDWVAGIGRIRVRPYTTISVWLNLSDDSNPDIEQGDQSKGTKVVYKEKETEQTVDYRDSEFTVRGVVAAP